MEASGVPPHIVIAAQMMKVDAKLVEFEETLLECLSLIPEQVKHTILDNFRVEGVIPMTHTEIEGVVTRIVEESSKKLLQAVTTLVGDRSSGGQSASAASAAPNNPWNALSGYASFQWSDGRSYPVPEDYKFPR
jgi:hypothetical protein